jgi:hypothetical protein
VLRDVLAQLVELELPALCVLARVLRLLVLGPGQLPKPALDDSQARVVTLGGEGELDERRVVLALLLADGADPAKGEIAWRLDPLDPGTGRAVLSPVKCRLAAGRRSILGEWLNQPATCSGSVSTAQTTSIGASIRISRSMRSGTTVSSFGNTQPTVARYVVRATNGCRSTR